jgi:hypothetical protein
MLKVIGREIWTGFMLLGRVGCGERDNEPSSAIEGEELLGFLSDS